MRTRLIVAHWPRTLYEPAYSGIFRPRLRVTSPRASHPDPRAFLEPEYFGTAHPPTDPLTRLHARLVAPACLAIASERRRELSSEGGRKKFIRSQAVPGEGMRFGEWRPGTLRQQLQCGRKQGHHKDLLDANQQVDCGRCSVRYLGDKSPPKRMSTGEKHLHGDRPEYLSACNRLTRFRPPAPPSHKRP